MASTAHIAKEFLRPAVRAVRRLMEKDVFEARHWQPGSKVQFSGITVSEPLEVDFLWYSGPENFSQVFVDADFPVHQDYPLTGTKLLPLIEVYTASGRRYLSLVHCPKTGVVFHQLLPSHEWQHKYYAENWDASGQVQSANADAFMKTRGNKVEKILTRADLKAGGRVLDVGCGYGDQLFYLKQKGYQVFGLEPSRHRAKFASQLLGTPILNSPVEGEQVHANLSGLGGKFDLIYLNHVFEHLYDPRAVAAMLREFLADDGVLMIGVPDYFSECTTSFSNLIIHTHSFTKNALVNLLGLAGFKPKQDLSYPGYVYCLFEKSAGERAPQEDPLTEKVVRHLFRQFNLVSRQLRPGHVVSVASFIGNMETGYRVKRAPILAEARQALNDAKSKGAEALRRCLPIKIVMPYEQPCIWQK
ncbi:MAG: class I SAM-dependent methyltransferase [Gammaproteobacteria bacterium]|nr:class I SAM-dependent methyltransferase [Gammaproteobacteria bacterium]